MKKIFSILLIFSLIFSCGCSRKATEKREPVVTHNPADYRRTYNIIEEHFITMISDIFANPSAYINNNINIEGMFKEENGHFYVYRNGPECCYPEGTTCGLEFEPGDASFNTDEWILVSGTLSYYDENGSIKLILKDCAVTKPEKRGLETLEHQNHETEEIIPE